MHAIVTGGAGFIGSNFVRFLAEQEPSWTITVIDSLTYAGNLENISDLLESSGRVRFVKIDIADERAIREFFEAQGKLDLMFHFAAESHVDRSIQGAHEFVRTNVLGTQVLLDAWRTFSKGRFLHVSTDEVYGSLGETGVFYEHTPLDPTSPYAASKASSDLMALAAAKTHHMDVVVTRCTNNYGPLQFPEKFIPLFVTNTMEGKSLPVYGDGMQVRSWLHVVDHCRGIYLAALKGKTGEVYNFGGGHDGERPNIEVAKEIISILGASESLLKRVADRPAHDRRYAVDWSKSQKELGWSPQVNFKEGLRATVEWYQTNKAWWNRVKSGEYQQYYSKQYGASA